MSGVASFIRLAVSAVVAALVIAACAPRPEPDGEPEASGGDGDANGSAGSDAGQEAPRGETEMGEGITLSLAMAPSSPAAAEPLEFTLAVSNASGAELVLDFADGQRFDFEVEQGGTALWRWAADMFFTQMLGRETIPAGESIQWSATLEAGVASGDYLARGTLTSNERHSVELAFTVP